MIKVSYLAIEVGLGIVFVLALLVAFWPIWIKLGLMDGGLCKAVSR
jgi:hypothetical protein